MVNVTESVGISARFVGWLLRERSCRRLTGLRTPNGYVFIGWWQRNMSDCNKVGHNELEKKMKGYTVTLGCGSSSALRSRSSFLPLRFVSAITSVCKSSNASYIFE